MIAASDGGVEVWSAGNASGAFLTGFDRGGVELKPGHRPWLDSFAVRLQALTGDLYIVGLTAPDAGDQEDRGVAERRARTVYRYLRRGTRSFPWVHVHVGSKGKGLAGTPAQAPARHRGVGVIHVALGRVPRWLRGSLQRRPLPTNIFYVRLVGFGAVPELLSGRAPVDGASFAVLLEIGDGRWSVLYRAFGEATQSGIAAGEPVLPEPYAVGPWHTFQSPFELTVKEFARTRVDLGRHRWRPETLKLQISRPPVTIHPFLTGPAMSASALAKAVTGADSETDLAAATRGPLDAQGRAPFEHEIPARIRAHLRKGGGAGPRSRE